MLFALLMQLFGKNSHPQRSMRPTYRPRLLAFEDRIVPADLTWVGPADGTWSTPANWNPPQLPGGADSVYFNPALGTNTNSTMNLGGGATFHIGRLFLAAGYTGVLTLNSDLYVDRLDMRSGTITGPKWLTINQRTTLPAGYSATIFETSVWAGGTISTTGDPPGLFIQGEHLHRATLQLGATGSTPNLQTDFTVVDAFSTVNWQAGNVTVGAGRTVEIRGTFLADAADRTMGNALGAGNRWTLRVNGGRLNHAFGGFVNANVTRVNNGWILRRASLTPGAAPPEIVGTLALEGDAGPALTIESGTLLVTGTLTQSAGDVTFSPGTSLSVTEGYTLSGGTVADAGVGTSLTVGSLLQTGGTLTVSDNATLTSTSTVTVSGGTLVLQSGGSLSSTYDVQILSGGTLNGVGTITIASGALINAGTINVAGASALGTLNVNGNYIQTGTLNVEIGSSGYDKLQVTGLATLAGILNASFLGGYMPLPGIGFSVLSYGTRSGTFGSLNLPTLTSGFWDPRYDDPADTFTLWVVN